MFKKLCATHWRRFSCYKAFSKRTSSRGDYPLGSAINIAQLTNELGVGNTPHLTLSALFDKAVFYRIIESFGFLQVFVSYFCYGLCQNLLIELQPKRRVGIGNLLDIALFNA